MEFYVTWTECDPVFQNYDPECRLLLSPSLLTINWSVKKWTVKPYSLFIDSGSYSSDRDIPVNLILKDQVRIIKGANQDGNIYFAHPDIILQTCIPYHEEIRFIKKNLARAQEYIDLVYKQQIDVCPVGIIQASSEEDFLCSFYQLKDMGYSYFGVGSISKRMIKEKNLLPKILKIIQTQNIKPVHLFGISPFFLTDTSLFRVIASFDTSAPIRLGYYGTVLYSNPFRRYVIKPNAYQKHRDKNFAFRLHLEEPFNCECPICKEDPFALLNPDKKVGKTNRIIHNYFQIKMESTKI